MGISADDLSVELREQYEERAAIFEFDAGMSRRKAEAMALREVEELHNRATRRDHSEGRDAAIPARGGKRMAPDARRRSRASRGNAQKQDCQRAQAVGSA